VQYNVSDQLIVFSFYHGFFDSRVRDQRSFNFSRLYPETSYFDLGIDPSVEQDAIGDALFEGWGRGGTRLPAKARNVGLGIRFFSKLRFGFLVLKNFGFSNIRNRSVF